MSKKELRPNEIFERMNKNATCQNKDFLITKSRSQADFFFPEPSEARKKAEVCGGRDEVSREQSCHNDTEGSGWP